MRQSSWALVALIVVASFAACDSPARNTPPPPPPPPPLPAPTAIRIDGPASVAPGASVQFRLIATYANGTTADVASQAAWASNNPSVLTIAAGLASGKARGGVHVTVRYQNLTSGVVVVVLEDGTFRLSGRVMESGGGLPDARIDVLAGTGAGLSTTSLSGGFYVFFGVAGEVQLEVSLAGFEKGLRTVVVNENTSDVNLELRPSIEPTDLRGDWRLTLTASSACESTVPPDVTTRSYDVAISQTVTFLQLDVKGASIRSGAGARVTGRVVDRHVTFTMQGDDFYYYGFRYYSIIDALGPARFLGLAGTARGERAGAAVTGTLDGEFAMFRSSNGDGVRDQDSSCRRDDHLFRLDRS